MPREAREKRGAGKLGIAAALLAASSAAATLAGGRGSLAAGVAAALAVLAAAAALAPRPSEAAREPEAQREEATDAGAGLPAAEIPPPDTPAPLPAPEPVAPAGGRDGEADWAASALRRLRFADAVLAKVPAITEEAAFALMERLASLRDQGARAASDATAAEENDAADTDAVLGLATQARHTIADVRAALAEMKRHDGESSSALKALGRELAAGIELLAGIGEITERSRLIAFNLAIEAAKIGDRGRGFKVIVGELRALNDKTADFSRRVTDLLGKFRAYNESLVGDSIEHSVRLADEVERSVGEEEKTIEALLSASTSCFDLSENVMTTVRDMDRELDGVLESLQYQDITRQMIEGARATIAEAEAELRSPSAPADAEAEGRERRATEELRAVLLSRAKTKGEKEAIREVRP